MKLELVSQARCFDGEQRYYKHTSATLACDMRFSVFLPPQAQNGNCPVVWYLSGLTCTEDNATVKAGFQRTAAELGLIIVCPDTSPRGGHVPDDEAYDFGKGAGFYLDATEAPWAKNFQMETYITKELPDLIGAELPVDMSRQGITGHSMGGHGALTLALKNPAQYKSVSAFSPICSPIECPWGQKALAGYLGENSAAWRRHDACALLADGGPIDAEILVDQGLADDFMESQLKPGLLEAAAEASCQKFTVRRQAGYDHSYFFIASFMEDHLRFHSERLKG